MLETSATTVYLLPNTHPHTPPRLTDHQIQNESTCVFLCLGASFPPRRPTDQSNRWLPPRCCGVVVEETAVKTEVGQHPVILVDNNSSFLFSLMAVWRGGSLSQLHMVGGRFSPERVSLSSGEHVEVWWFEGSPPNL